MHLTICLHLSESCFNVTLSIPFFSVKMAPKRDFLLICGALGFLKLHRKQLKLTGLIHKAQTRYLEEHL